VYTCDMAKQVIHISEAEAARTFPSLIASVRAGAEVIIEDNAQPIAVIQAANTYVRLLSESLRMARERGSTATLDGDFGRDLEEAVNSHPEPLDTSAWE
jgi:antitoxin (DNA-binding transcriptional repressor) of toxin-antitoxin stability system